MTISRRSFLAAPALATLARQAVEASVDPKTGMPMRVLGRTGASVSILAFGCGSRFLMYKEEDKALEAGRRALAQGITYIDTAQTYGNGVSETRVGKLLQGRRAGVWLATKIQERNPDQAMRNMEQSLKRLQTDQVDLVHIHALGGPEDLAGIEAKGGLLETMYKIREQKMARFIGVTSHTDPVTLKAALERHDFDCTQMALNAALVGMRSGQGGMAPNPDIKESFEKTALPVALRKKIGVIAMKAYAQGPLAERTAPEKLVRYALTLPVAAAVVGMPTLEFIDDNARIAKGFKPLGASDMDSLSGELSRIYKASLDRFFAAHVDS
jgi:aryl-alcohol dehydrogenase-like predicted oxidoreductase